MLMRATKSGEALLYGGTTLLVAKMWALLTLWAAHEHTATIENTKEILRQLSSGVAEHFRGVLKRTEVSLNAGNLVLKQYFDDDDTLLPRLLPLAVELQDKSDGLIDLLVVRGTGEVVVLPPRPNLPPAQVGDRDYVMAQRLGEQRLGTKPAVFIGAPITGRMTGEWLLPVTIAPQRAPNGTFLVAAVRPERLARIHDRQRMPETGSIGIIRSDSVLLSRAPFEPKMLGTKATADINAVWDMHGNLSYVSQSAGTDQIPRLINVAKLPDYGLFVYVADTMESILAPWRARTLAGASVVGGLSVAFVVMAVLLGRNLRRMQESHRRFADFAETASDLVWETDTAMRFTFVSNHCDAVLGVDASRILGMSVKDIGWRSIDDLTRQRFAAAVEGRRAFTDLRFMPVGSGAAGSAHGAAPRIAQVSGRPYFQRGSYAGYRGVMTDITERVLQEEERQRQAEREAQVGKMEALGQLAGGIAHDFNNLLGAILGFGQFLVQDTPPDSPLRRYAERVVLAGQRGRGLVQQILAFSRRASGEPADIILAGVVTDTVELLRATVPSSTTLIVENAGGDLAIRGDHSRISQVVLNLCINASDALEHKDGEVRIAVLAFDGGHPAAGRLRSGEATASGRPCIWQDELGFDWACLGHLTGQRYALIRVTDTGSGIPQAILPRLFELFFSTKAGSGGSGMGLAVVQRVVEECGGAIAVRTKFGCGTSFEVILPSVDSAAPPPEPPKRVSVNTREPIGHRATILVVDDDVDFCDMLEASLCRMGHEVVASNSPLEALAAVEEDTTLWDIVITDLSMPGMKGDELVRRVKAAAPRIRCILCTGDSSTFGEPQALEAGADAFRTKPLDLDELGSLVSRMSQAQTLEPRD